VLRYCSGESLSRKDGAGVKVWRRSFVVALALYGEKQRAADTVGITVRRVQQLEKSDERFAAEVTGALLTYATRTEAEQLEFLRSVARRSLLVAS
jgi:hypothetical protein